MRLTIGIGIMALAAVLAVCAWYGWETIWTVNADGPTEESTADAGVVQFAYPSLPETMEWGYATSTPGSIEWKRVYSFGYRDRASGYRNVNLHGLDEWARSGSTLVRMTYKLDAERYPLRLPILSASPSRLYREFHNFVFRTGRTSHQTPLVENLSDIDDGLVDERDILLRINVHQHGLTLEGNQASWTRVFESITATSTVPGIPVDKL